MATGFAIEILEDALMGRMYSDKRLFAADCRVVLPSILLCSLYEFT